MFNPFITQKRILGDGGPNIPTPVTPSLKAPPEQDVLRSVSILRVQDLLCSGPIYGFVDIYGMRTGGAFDDLKSVFLDDTPVLDQQGNFNYRKVDFDIRHGQETQSSFPNNKVNAVYEIDQKLLGAVIEGGNAQEGTGNQDIRSGSEFENRNFTVWTDIYVDDPYGYTHFITNQDVEEFYPTFRIDQLYDTIVEGDNVGEVIESFVDLKIEIGRETNSGAEIVNTIVFRVEGRVTSSYLIDFKGIKGVRTNTGSFNSIENNNSFLVLPPAIDGRNRFVKITKETGETISPLIGRKVSLYSITEVINESLSYPLQAVVDLQIDARHFTDIPQRSYDGRWKICHIPTNYSVLGASGIDLRRTENPFYPTGQAHQIYSGDWDGTFYLQWTDNPAWILYDLIVDNVNGIGDLVPIELTNKWKLYEIGRYCDAVDESGFFVGVDNDNGFKEPRFSANFVLNEERNAFDFLNYVATLFRGLSFWSNGGIDFADDRKVEPILNFNNTNVVDGKFTYSSTSTNTRYTAVEVSFLDERDNFQPKIEYVEDENGIRRYGLRKNRVNAEGITSRSQARRLGRQIIANSIFETELIEFTAGLESAYLRPGDIFSVRDELKIGTNVFGRIFNTGVENGSGFLDFDRTISKDATGVLVTVPTNPKFLEELNSIDLVSGETVPLSDILNLRQKQVFQYQVENVIDKRVYISEEPSGVKIGSASNLFISGEDLFEYKLINISEEGPNQYKIAGVEFDKEKFEYIESGIFQESLPSNLTVINNVIQRPAAPTNFTLSKSSFDISGFFDITGQWNAPVGSTAAASYRIEFFDPFGIKTVDTSNTTSYLVTGLREEGTYSFEVYSISAQPQSFSSRVPAVATIDIAPFTGDDARNNFLITGLSVNNQISNNFTVSDPTSTGTAEYANLSPTISWSLIAPNDSILSSRSAIQNNAYYSSGTINILDETGGFVSNGNQIEINYDNNSFFFSESLNREVFGELTRNFTFQIIVDDVFGGTATGELLCKNPLPEIKSVVVTDQASGITNNIAFDVIYSGYNDISAIFLTTGDNPNFVPNTGEATSNVAFEAIPPILGSSFTFRITENDIPANTLTYFKLVPLDPFGTGEAFGPLSGILKPETIQSEIALLKSGSFFVTTTGEDQFVSGNKYFDNIISTNFRIGIQIPLEATGDLPSNIYNQFTFDTGKNLANGYFPREALHLGSGANFRMDSGNLILSYGNFELTQMSFSGDADFNLINSTFNLDSSDIIFTGVNSALYNAYLRGMSRFEIREESPAIDINISLFGPTYNFFNPTSSGININLPNPTGYDGLNFVFVNQGAFDMNILDMNTITVNNLSASGQQEIIWNGSTWLSRFQL